MSATPAKLNNNNKEIQWLNDELAHVAVNPRLVVPAFRTYVGALKELKTRLQHLASDAQRPTAI